MILTVVAGGWMALCSAPLSPSVAHAEAASLTAAYDNIAVALDGAPDSADLDGAGNSISAADLTAAGWRPGSPVTVDGATFTLPDVAPGRPDNIVAAGQTVAMTGSGDALSFLATSTNGDTSGSGLVTYRDGTYDSYRLTVQDWASERPGAAALTVRQSQDGAGHGVGHASLYAVSVPLTHGKSVASVTLPRTAGGQLHVFGIAVRNTSVAPHGTWWTGSWATSFGSAPAVPQAPDWKAQTFRMVIDPHLSGTTARLRFSDTFSPVPLVLGHATVAVQASGAGAIATPTDITFGGSRQMTIPAGADVYSDPVTLPITAGHNLLVSIYLPDSVTVAPVHSYALTTSYLSGRLSGDHTSDTSGAAMSTTFSYWTILSGLDVQTDTNVGTLVAFGDSQTDGGHSTANTNRRWPDDYAKETTGEPAASGVVNAGISGNRLLTDSGSPSGPSGISRLDHDVFSEPNVRTLVLYEGINDIAFNNASAVALVSGIQQVVAQAHARGVKVIVATIPPFGGNTDYSESRENVREAVNSSIRTAVSADGYADFDLATRDPDMPSRLRSGIYDSTDHLHFNDTGCQVLADTLANGLTGSPVRMSQTSVGDVDGDFVDDVMARDDSTGTLRLRRGNGDGTLAPPTDVTTGWRPYGQTVTTDVNGDSLADILAADSAGNLKMWAGRGNGTFASATTVTTGWSFTQTAAADFNDDGATDLIARDSAGNLKMWPGRGNGTFASPTTVTTGWSFTQTAAADFNDDGQADIIARDSTGTLKMWTHNSAGTFSTAVPVTSGWNFSQTAAGDVTGDGKADIVARDSAGDLKMWAGRGDGTFVTSRVIATGW
jgi:lysophospholipase L1-like esterase